MHFEVIRDEEGRQRLDYEALKEVPPCTPLVWQGATGDLLYLKARSPDDDPDSVWMMDLRDGDVFHLSESVASIGGGYRHLTPRERFIWVP